jgi:hypothetical protein
VFSSNSASIFSSSKRFDISSLFSLMKLFTCFFAGSGISVVSSSKNGIATYLAYDALEYSTWHDCPQFLQLKNIQVGSIVEGWKSCVH